MKRRSRKDLPGLSPYKIAAVYIGTVVGAGFASGQEVLQFFGFFGLWGAAGLFVATAFFALFGARLMIIAHRLQAESYKPVIDYLGSRWLGALINLVITFFLFGMLVSMVAGVGATFEQEFQLPESWGVALMAALAGATVLLGLGRVINALTAVVPLLVIAILGVGIYIFWAFPLELGWSAPEMAPLPSWWLSGIVYVSYNLVLAISVLAPLGILAPPRNLRKGAYLGAGGLGFCALIIFLAILLRAPFAADVEIPMLVIAGDVSAAIRLVYIAVLLLGIYTTAISSLFGFVSRLVPDGGTWFKIFTVITVVASFYAGRLGFSQIVAVVYPLVGIFGLFLLGTLAYNMYTVRLKER